MPPTRGEQRHLVAFDVPTRVPDGEGGYTETWAPLGPPTWAVAIRAATAVDAERAVAGTQITHNSYVITGDALPGVTTKARMTYQGHVYQVTSAIDVDLRGITMELIADRQQ